MADRRRQNEQLIATRYDQLYLPKGSLVTPSGLAPAERKPCLDCGGILLLDDFGKQLKRRRGKGWITDRFHRRQPCTKCGGEWVDAENFNAGSGWVATDPMDSLNVRVGSETTAATAHPRRTVECDSCAGAGVVKGERCRYCDGQGRRDMHVFELHVTSERETSGDPLTDAIEARDESGSYRELEQALVGILHHVNKPPRYHWLTLCATEALRLLDEIYLVKARDEWQLTPSERMLVDLAFDYLDWRMPDPIRVPSAVRANEREHKLHRERVKHTRGLAAVSRDREIRQAIRRGLPTQRVAFEYGLSVSQVNRIVDGETDAA